ncbi:ABC transporter permease subunit [Phyllobacterium myrsinacearum]|uniref:Taurine transport system permease protein n=1 Tax=Phyllobacterium myrsinacearum TaxID=28101 RepID=A0A839EKN3_9HYPH|nr:ABC transporter permease subunit [Phyllobacterium myrsinacearum]MBA8878046.1 taurine transport system permease protein [Phyllobacterium myrsinacearum]
MTLSIEASGDIADAAVGSVPTEPKAKPSAKRTARIASAVTVTGLLLLWIVSAHFKLVSPVFLPSPAAVLWKFYSVATNGFVDATLWQHLLASLLRVFAALLFALLVAVPAGIAIGVSAVGRGIFDPIIEFIRPIPPLAYLPLVIIWFGIGEPSKILVIAIAMLAPIAISTAAGVKGASLDRINAARALGATRLQVIRHVILPSALPNILTGLRIALGAGWSTLVAAELVAATRGLGFMIQSAAQFLVTDVVIMGIFVIAGVAFILEIGIRRLERLLVPWAGKE